MIAINMVATQMHHGNMDCPVGTHLIADIYFQRLASGEQARKHLPARTPQHLLPMIHLVLHSHFQHITQYAARPHGRNAAGHWISVRCENML